MKLRVSNLYKYAIYFIILLDISFFWMMTITTNNRLLFTWSASIVLTMLMKKDMVIYETARQGAKNIRIYLYLVLMMIAVQFVYTSIKNQFVTEMFLRSSGMYLVVLFAFPLLCLFAKQGSTEPFMKALNWIMLIWYGALLFQAFMYNVNHTLVLKGLASVGLAGNNVMKDGTIRLEMRSLSHLVIVYNFDKFYNQTESRHKIAHLLMAIIGVSTMFLVEHTRGFYIAIFAAIFALVLCYNKRKTKFLLTGILVLGILIFIAKTGIVEALIYSLTDPTSGRATAGIRLIGMEIFFKNFLINPLTGFGFQPTGDSVFVGASQFYFNDNGFVGIIGQIGIWAFIIYGFMLFRFLYILIQLRKHGVYKIYTKLVGYYVFLLATSLSLICYWNTTCLLCPVLWAIFEFEYSNSIITKSKYAVGVSQ